MQTKKNGFIRCVVPDIRISVITGDPYVFRDKTGPAFTFTNDNFEKLYKRKMSKKLLIKTKLFALSVYALNDGFRTFIDTVIQIPEREKTVFTVLNKMYTSRVKE